MILRELFDTPSNPTKSVHSSPGNEHYDFRIGNREYEIVIKIRYNRINGRTYIIDFAYLGEHIGDAFRDVDYHTRLDNTDFRTDSYKVLGTVARFVENYFKDKNFGWDDLIKFEPNTGSKEKLYGIFAKKLAAQLGMKYHYNDENTTYIIGKEHAISSSLID